VAAGLRLALNYVQERTVGSAPRQTGKDEGEIPTILVEAAWRDGVWKPQAVWLHGRRQQVVGVGRQNRTAEGNWIMTVEFGDGGRAELLADVQSGLWLLRRYWPARRFA